MIDRDKLAAGLLAAEVKTLPMSCPRCGRALIHTAQRRWCCNCGHVLTPYYYMINIRHPVMGRLWAQARKQMGVPPHVAPSDTQRLAFELSLLSEAACRALAEYVGGGQDG